MKIEFNKTFYIRLAAIIIVLLIAIWMFFIGKQHTILLDNKTVDNFKALSEVEVSVDKLEKLYLLPRDRDQAIVTGQTHKVYVKYTDASWNEIEIVRKIKLPLGESMMLFSIPVFVADPDAPQDTYLTPFKVQLQISNTGDDLNIQDENALISDI